MAFNDGYSEFYDCYSNPGILELSRIEFSTMMLWVHLPMCVVQSSGITDLYCAKIYPAENPWGSRTKSSGWELHFMNTTVATLGAAAILRAYRSKQ